MKLVICDVYLKFVIKLNEFKIKYLTNYQINQHISFKRNIFFKRKTMNAQVGSTQNPFPLETSPNIVHKDVNIRSF